MTPDTWKYIVISVAGLALILVTVIRMAIRKTLKDEVNE